MARRRRRRSNFRPNAVVANSFSKYFCMTGWRIGWLVLPEHLIRPIERLQQSLSISVPFFSQIGAEVVFDAQEELEAVRAGYAKNREISSTNCPAWGLISCPPMAPFISTSIFRGSAMTLLIFAQDCLTRQGLGRRRGLDFDRLRGKSAMRLSFAGPERESSRRCGG